MGSQSWDQCVSADSTLSETGTLRRTSPFSVPSQLLIYLLSEVSTGYLTCLLWFIFDPSLLPNGGSRSAWISGGLWKFIRNAKSQPYPWWRGIQMLETTALSVSFRGLGPHLCCSPCILVQPNPNFGWMIERVRAHFFCQQSHVNWRSNERSKSNKNSKTNFYAIS